MAEPKGKCVRQLSSSSKDVLGHTRPNFKWETSSPWYSNPDDVGPFWMNKSEQAEKRHDRIIEGQTTKRQYTKEELVKALKEQGIVAKGKKEAVVRIAQEHGLPIEEVKSKIVEGWEGKAKGLLQVLWERGFS